MKRSKFMEEKELEKKKKELIKLIEEFFDNNIISKKD